MTVSQKQTRLEGQELKELLPDLYPAVRALSASATPAGLDRALVELVYLRASQINGCAYCVQMHITKARTYGVPDAKLNLTVAWREAGIFSEREAAALAWTEALTLVAETHVPDEAYAATRRVFSEQELAGLTVAISTINVWNRIAIAYRYAPEV